MTDDSKPAAARKAGCLAKLWDVKVKLQFTGWLQFLPTLFWALIALLVSGMLAVLPVPRMMVHFFVFLGSLFLVVFIFDVLAVKYCRLPEPLRNPYKKMDVFDIMRHRPACRSFQKRNLSDAHLREFLDTVARASDPSQTLGKVPVRFEYVEAPLTVWPVCGAHQFVVAIAPKEYDRTAIIDVGHTLQQAVIHVTGMGVATCWIGPGADHNSLKQHLGSRFDSDKDHIICTCAVGYASIFVPLFIRIFNYVGHSRKPLSELFFSDHSGAEPLDTSEKPFSQFGRCYEACQWAPSSFNEQPVRCAPVVEKGVLKRFDFFQSTASKWYAPVALGIWCANWEIGCKALGKQGHWEVLEHPEYSEAMSSASGDSSASSSMEHGSPLLSEHYGASWILD